MNRREMAVRFLPPLVKRSLLDNRRHVWEAIIRYRVMRGQLGPLPAFLILGFGRCGTTYLYHRLQDHPDIYPGLTKEINYFIFWYDRGVDWYRAHFASALEAPSNGTAMVGEASPGYVLHPLAPLRVRESLPDAKLIVLVRDPVARAYSQYHHLRLLGFEPLPTFEEALAAEPVRLGGDPRKILADPNTQAGANYVHSYLAQGIYSDFLERWFDVFPREQVMVTQAEAMYRHPAGTLQAVTDFLGLPGWTPPEHRGHKAYPYPPINPETKARLKEFFAPHNERLFGMMGADYGWNA